MRGWFYKVTRGQKLGLIPADDAARSLLERMADHECAEFSIVRPRSSAWHRLYFALCRMIGDNQDPPRDESSIDMELRILGGHYEVMHVEGHEVRVPKRIAFDRMDGDEWAEYFRKVEQAIVVRFGDSYIAEIGRVA